MAISKVKGSAIQDATIPEDKLEDEAGSFRMILDGSDGSATDAGDFVLLDATASSTNVGEQFLFEPATDDGSAVLSGGDLKFNNVEILMNETSLIKSGIGDTTTNIAQGLLKMWADLSGSGSPVIDDSLNTSSVTDVGSGERRINLTTSMVNTNYMTISGMIYDGNSGGNRGAAAHHLGTTATGSVQYKLFYGSTTSSEGAVSDSVDQDGCAIAGDLA